MASDDHGHLALQAEVIRGASLLRSDEDRLELVHHHPGRLRVRAEAFRQGREVAEHVREATLGIPGVIGLNHSTRTGSILIQYEPGHAEPDVILNQVAQSAGIAPCAPDALARTRTPALVAVGVAQELNAIVGELTGHRTDLRSLIPTGLAALCAYSFLAGKEPKLPRWDNLLWWSYSAFMNHHGEEIATSAEERRLARRRRAEQNRDDGATKK